MEKLPLYIPIIFLATVALTFFLLINASNQKTKVAFICLVWLIITGLLGWKGFFQNTNTIPPRLAFAMVPVIVVIILLITIKKGNNVIGNFDLRNLTLLSIVRLPVEFTLYWLAAQKTIPELMTFGGRNFDILSGLTALIVYFICFKGTELKNRKLLLVWNFIGLALLLNIVINALLSVPFPFQQFAFDQPNIAVLYFPFCWLPTFIVLVVLFSHIISIKKLLQNENVHVSFA